MTAPYLDAKQAADALNFVLGNWPKSAPMRAEERDAWWDVLAKLHPCELRAALGRRTDNQAHRPDPYVVLQLAQEARQEHHRRRRMEEDQAPLRELRRRPHARETSTMDVGAYLDEVRTQCGFQQKQEVAA